MQIILLEKIVNVGNLGDVVKVKHGYARNYLIPQGKAKRAELEKVAADKFAASQAEAARLEGLVVQITQKAGVDGRLFGSVTNVDIVDALKAQGFAVEKADIRMPTGPLKQVGDHPLVVALHTDAHANITVTVIGEQVTS